MGSAFCVETVMQGDGFCVLRERNAFSDCHFHHLHKQTAIQVIWIEGGEEEGESERKGKRVSGFWVVLELEWLIRQSSEEKPKKSV
ncbi:hypothetical protein AAC387_Pa11g1215 [Persea americana]